MCCCCLGVFFFLKRMACASQVRVQEVLQEPCLARIACTSLKKKPQLKKKKIFATPMKNINKKKLKTGGRVGENAIGESTPH